MDDPDSTYTVLGRRTFGADDEDEFGLLRDDRENNPQEQTTQELAQVPPVNVTEELHQDPDLIGTLDLTQDPPVYVIQEQRHAMTNLARDAALSNTRKRKFTEEGELNDTLSTQPSRRRDEPSADQRQAWLNEKHCNHPVPSSGMQQRSHSRGCEVASIHGGMPHMQARGPYQYNLSRPFPSAAPQNTYHQLPVANRIYEPWRLPNTSQQHPVTNQMANLVPRQTMMPMPTHSSIPRDMRPMQDPMMYPYQHPVANQQNLYDQHPMANEQNLYQHLMANPRMPQFRNDEVFTTSTIPPPRGQPRGPRPVAIGQNYLNTQPQQPQQPRAEVNHQQLQQRVPRQSQGPSSEQGGDQQQQPR